MMSSHAFSKIYQWFSYTHGVYLLCHIQISRLTKDIPKQIILTSGAICYTHIKIQIFVEDETSNKITRLLQIIYNAVDILSQS